MQAVATRKGESADVSAGQPVAIKALSLRGRGFDWKQLQLFEREAATLKSLNHPGVPRYIDYFEVDSERDRGFFLVQVCNISMNTSP
jgi:serine/threonine protein kinase